LNLTAREFDLLLALLRRQGEIVSCASLAKEVWGGNLNADAPLIRVTIQRLRGKLDDPFGIKLLHTVRGAGYVLGDNPWGSTWFLGTPSTPAS
jgi:two-component system copper resistance phosphate regulon response regulator CusR